MKELNEPITERRRLTRNSIYRYIYETENASTTGCINALSLSAPTVYQNLSELIDADLVCYGAEQPSTGGRRARSLGVVPDARIAIGVSVNVGKLRMAAADLRLTELAYRKTEYPATEDMRELGAIIAKELEIFIDENELPREKLLGVGIAIPGVIDRERSLLIRSPTMDLVDISFDGLTESIPYPTFVENDGNCGGYAEWFALKDRSNMAYMTLEDGVGGAVLVNGDQYSGDNLRSGEFGHMCVQPDGEKCKCGKKGCLEAYCSVRRISDDLGIAPEEFFDKLAAGDADCARRWDELLHWLAIGVSNLRMALDCDIVLGGFLAQFMEPYIGTLRSYVAERSAFESNAKWLRLSRYPKRAIVLGAALHYIGEFIDSI